MHFTKYFSPDLVWHHRVKPYQSQKKMPSAETLMKLIWEGGKLVPEMNFQPPVQIEIPKRFFATKQFIRKEELKRYYESSHFSMTTGHCTFYGGPSTFNEKYYSKTEMWLMKFQKSERPYYEAEQEIKNEAKLFNPCHLHRKYYSTRKPLTVKDLKTAFAKAKGRGKLQEKIYVGSLLLDLEATVNNRSIHKPGGDYAGRNPGIRGWIFENCIELLNSYTTLMHYKGIADKVKKEVGLEKSLTPIDIFLPDAQDTDVEMKPKLSSEEITSVREKLAALLNSDCSITPIFQNKCEQNIPS